MPHAILFQSGFTGVDLKSNPLIIGERRKLRFATNIIFDEGVVRTRYGYRYEPLADAGQFQGACEFTPSQGISSSSFSDIQSGIALMVAGNLWFNGVLVGEGIYETTNNVNLYGAENYLIIQNLSGDTFWWDGDTFTRSPGMNEADFNDPETPTIEVDLDAPVLTLEPCVDDPCDTSGEGVTFRVVNHVTEAIVVGAYVEVNFKDSVAYSGITDVSGKVSFDMVSRNYLYHATATNFYPSDEFPLVAVQGVPQNKTIRIIPIDTSPLEPFNIHGFLSVFRDFDFVPGRYDLSAFFGPQLVPPGNAYRTKWRLRTDACGYDIIYPVTGELDNNGHLLPGETPPGVWVAYFDAATREFVSDYTYAEGIYLQLGVLVEGVWTWADASPCIEGGNGTP